FLFLFLPVTLLGYFLLPERVRNVWLFLASVVFYATSSWFFLPLLLITISVDFLVGGRIHRAESQAAKRRWLLVSLLSNFGMLATFKYIGFLTRTLRSIGLSSVPEIDAPLPVGISFYVFQSMSYTIDVYRGEVPPARRFLNFGAFVTMYPQLIAG